MLCVLLQWARFLPLCPFVSEPATPSEPLTRVTLVSMRALLLAPEHRTPPVAAGELDDGEVQIIGERGPEEAAAHAAEAEPARKRRRGLPLGRLRQAQISCAWVDFS